MTVDRPIVGVTCMNLVDAGGGTLMAVRPVFPRVLERAGAVPLLIPLSDDLQVVRRLYDLCDGILLPGGVDVDPACYGEAPHPQLGAIDQQRDAVELNVARWSREDSKPLLGICRGIQTINVAFGGTLYQDIPSQLPGSLDHWHNTHIRQYDVQGHTITLDDNCWIAEKLGVVEIMANTMHHQAVKDVAPGLRVVGHAPDGVIEALEGSGDQLVVAVQCHPEHLWQAAEPRWLGFFQGFVAACGR